MLKCCTMSARLVLVCLLLLSAVLPESSCEDRATTATQEGPTKKSEKKVEHLTEKDVKPALLRMIAEHPKIFGEYAADAVRESPIELLNAVFGDAVSVGNFTCYLDRTWILVPPCQRKLHRHLLSEREIGVDRQGDEVDASLIAILRPHSAGSMLADIDPLHLGKLGSAPNAWIWSRFSSARSFDVVSTITRPFVCTSFAIRKPFSTAGLNRWVSIVDRVG